MKAITDLRTIQIECDHCHRMYPPEEMDGFICVTCVTENEAEWLRSYSADYERKEQDED